MQEILERKKEVSGQVSAQTRALALGMLAISWALLTTPYEPLLSMASHVNRSLILGLAVCAVVVIVLDLLQYVAATSVAEKATQEAEKANHRTATYDNNSFAYKAQAYLYHAKFVLLIVAGLLLLVIFIELFKSPVAEPGATASSTTVCCPSCLAAPSGQPTGQVSSH
jgi:hypothetical protein